MRILIVNTSEKTGGAALASNRLMEALNKAGCKAKMLVKDKETNQLSVVALPRQWLKRWHFLWERWCIFCHLHFNKRHLFAIDIANVGTDITQLREFQEADIIHLEWINQGMLSLRNIEKIVESGKPVVWTLHDIWPATGICHLSLSCTHFKNECGNCFYLPGGGSKSDLSHRIWQRKNAIYQQSNIHFVTCSDWLGQQAKASGLLSKQALSIIPNPIDTHVFAPASKYEAAQRLGLPTDRQLILFASQRITNVNKGIQYLIEACQLLVKQQPELKNSVGLVVLGGHAEEITARFDLPTYPLGYVNDTKKIVDVYNAVDLFVLPSLSENLPNTIMEAMACGVPCVGFEVGGIPEMIDHRENGYVAHYKDAQSLAAGMAWILDEETDYETLSKNCIHKVRTEYAQQRVAERYLDVYQSVWRNKKEE